MQDKKLNKLVKVSVLSAIALVLMFIEFPLPIFPGFLKLDISDLPAIFGAFALGIPAGIVIEALKNLLHGLIKTSTAGIGEIANFVVGSAYVIAAGAIYSFKKDKRHAVYGLIAGSIAMAVVAGITNYFIFIPLYENVLGFPIPAMIDAARVINPKITDFKGLIVMSIVPFNLLKAAIISIIALLSYKKLSPILHK